MEHGNPDLIAEYLDDSRRNDGKFMDLLKEVDKLASQESNNTIAPLENIFQQADQWLANELNGNDSRGLRAQFDLDLHGVIQNLSSLAVTQLNLRPGQRFRMPTPEAQELFRKIVDGKEERGLITISIGPFKKPILINLQRVNKQRISAKALSMTWLSIAETALIERFGLSEAEADVAHLIFDGAVPKDVARVRNRSVETVRKQIRSLLRKTGAKSLTDILHILYAFVGEADHLGLSGALFPGRNMIKLSNGNIYDVVIKGPKDGRPLLFIHGALGGRELHPDAMKTLKDRRIIAPGRPFHGQSRAQHIQATAQPQVADDLIELCDRLDAKNMDILAYNAGASHALTLAQRIPTRIGRMILVSPTPSIKGIRDILAMRSQERVFLLTAQSSQPTAMYLARLGGKKLINDGPEGFAHTVFSGLSADIDACQRNQIVQNLYWKGHAWHTEQGPKSFVSDIINARLDWQSELNKLDINITYIRGVEDSTVVDRPFQSLVNRTGGHVIAIKNRGLSLLHSNIDAWLDALNN